MKATVENIKEVIEQAEVLGDVSELQNDIKLSEQGVDSLDIVNIYLLIEEKFGVFISDEDLEQVKTIDDIIGYVNAKLES